MVLFIDTLRHVAHVTRDLSTVLDVHGLDGRYVDMVIRIVCGGGIGDLYAVSIRGARDVESSASERVGRKILGAVPLTRERILQDRREMK